MMERREPAQKIQMMLAPGGDLVEIVARGDGGAGQQQHEADSSRQGLTSLAGLPVYLDLVKAIGLAGTIRRRVCAAGSQGWLDIQMVLAVVFLNLAGGDCVADIERLERDGGFSAILRAIEKE